MHAWKARSDKISLSESAVHHWLLRRISFPKLGSHWLCRRLRRAINQQWLHLIILKTGRFTSHPRTGLFVTQGDKRSGEGKVLVFFWVWPFNMHGPYILSADDLDDFSGIYRKPSILAADDLLGACYRKAMTPKKLWTLLFRQKGGFVKGWFWRMCPRSGFRSEGTCERTLVPVFGRLLLEEICRF